MRTTFCSPALPLSVEGKYHSTMQPNDTGCVKCYLSLCCKQTRKMNGRSLDTSKRVEIENHTEPYRNKEPQSFKFKPYSTLCFPSRSFVPLAVTPTSPINTMP